MKNYVPVTLDSYLNESKTITLKRKYGNNESVVVGSNAPLRNQVLSYVSESIKVSKGDLKRFIAGLNEGSKNPIASANMWLVRNSKFFITENRNGITYFKLSPIGKRLANGFTTRSISESEEKEIRRKLNEEHPRFEDFDEEDIWNEEDEEKKNYDFIDRMKGKPRPGIYDEMTESEDTAKCEHGNDKEECDECDESKNTPKKVDESSKLRIKKIIENIRAKNANKLNEDDEEENEGKDKLKNTEEDELTFDDLDLDSDEDENKDEGEELEDEGEELEGEGEELEDEGTDLEDKGEKLEGGEEKVEITEFIITVENVEEAISELEELGVTAEQVLDEEGEPIEDQIKVSADHWEKLKEWLEEKGVDIEEMFGG